MTATLDTEAFDRVHHQLAAAYDAIAQHHDPATCSRCLEHRDVTDEAVVDVKADRGEPKWTRRLLPSRGAK